MKHATAAALATIEPLLDLLRQLPALQERRPGVFYRRGRACLHFHEDPAGLFADLRLEGDWERFPVNEPGDYDRLLASLNRP